MSSKSDCDNRSNQLNPNNDAYFSSRGGSRSDGHDDDAEDDHGRRGATYPGSAAATRLPVSRRETFAFAAVSMEGNVAFRTAVFVAPGHWSNSRAALVQLEDYLTDFVPLAKWRLAKLLAPSEIALFAIFDPTESCLPWHLPFSPKDPHVTRGWVSLQHKERLELICERLQPMPEHDAARTILSVLDPEGAKRNDLEWQELQLTKLDPAPFVEALREGVVLDATSWGEFSVPPRGRMLRPDTESVKTQLQGSETK